MTKTVRARCTLDIWAKGKRRFIKITTDNSHDLPIVLNVLDHQFEAAEPDRARAGRCTWAWAAGSSSTRCA